MPESNSQIRRSPARGVLAIVAWLWVLVPFAWGVWELVIKVLPLFSS
jgi:hypothetical protein